MSSIINFIIKMYTEYNSFSNYYIRELSSEISLFQLTNFIILLLILLYYVIKFLVKKYTLSKILIFILKRILISFFFIFIVYCFSTNIECETALDKNLNYYFNGIDAKTKKYIGITCVTVFTGYCAYKYLPLLYNKIYTHHLEYLPKTYNLNSYQIDLIKFYEYSRNNKFTSTQLKSISSNMTKRNEFDKKTENFDVFIETYKVEVKDKVNHLLFCLVNPSIEPCNNYLNTVLTRILDLDLLSASLVISYQKKLDNIYSGVKENNFIINKIIKSHKKYNISSDYYFLQDDIFKDLEELNKFYLNLVSIVTPIYKLELSNSPLSESQIDSIVELIDPLDEKLNDTLRNIYKLRLKLSKIEENYVPYVMYEPIFQTDSLDVLQVTGISLGYLVFYPVLYCSNKILGTVNPLSSKAFYDALWYILTFKFFF